MVDIAVCEMESKNAPCKALKLQLVKVMVNKEDFTDLQEFDEIVTIEDAQKAFPDFEVAVISPDNHILEIDRTAEEFAVIFMVPPSRSTTHHG